MGWDTKGGTFGGEYYRVELEDRQVLDKTDKILYRCNVNSTE